MESFRVPGSQLAMGASLGNSAIWIQTKGDGAIERIFLNSIAESLLGTVDLRYTGRPKNAHSYFSGLFAAGQRMLEIHPAYQRVRFWLIEIIDVVETTFLPLANGEPGDDEPVAYVVVEVENRDIIGHELRVIASAMLCGSTPTDVSARFDRATRTIVARNDSKPGWIRVIDGAEAPTHFSVDSNYVRSYDTAYPDALDDATSATGDVIGLTWWYAFAAARYHPHSMVRALRSSFEHYSIDPQRNNTVPGQFSEWFDGESLANRGMRLSPWEPPRFLWAAVEGVCGLVLLPGAPRVNPLMPSDWNWVALRDVPYHRRSFSYFFVREAEGNACVYATCPIDSDWRTEVYAADVSDSIGVYGKDAIAVALRRDNDLVLLVGNTGPETIYVPIQFTDEELLPTHAGARVYNSERRSWEELGTLDGSELISTAFMIDHGGFRLLEITARPSADPTAAVPT